VRALAARGLALRLFLVVRGASSSSSKSSSSSATRAFAAFDGAAVFFVLPVLSSSTSAPYTPARAGAKTTGSCVQVAGSGSPGSGSSSHACCPHFDETQ
jgi:hypothetical protein